MDYGIITEFDVRTREKEETSARGLRRDSRTGGDVYQVSAKKVGERIEAVAALHGSVIGRASAERVRGNNWYIAEAEVSHEHQRLGLASRMYDLIEDLSGGSLTHGAIMASPEAIGLWRKRLGESEDWAIEMHLDYLMDEGWWVVEEQIGVDADDNAVRRLARGLLGFRGSS